MRILPALLGLYFAFVIYGQAVMAMQPENIVPLAVTSPIVESVSNNKTAANIVSNWDVEEFSRENGFPTGECVTRAEYDNNLEITFKGKNGQLSALRIRDLNNNRQSSINGFSSLGLGDNSYGLQSRSKPGQIDASLLTVPAPAQKIMDLGEYKLRVGKQDYNFNAGEFAYAYYELMKCTGYENAKTLKVVSHSRSRRTPLKKAVNVPSLPAEPIDLVVETNIDVQSASAKSDAANVEDVDLSLEMQTWNAFKGDNVSSTLKDWANQAGVNANIDLSNDAKLNEDIRVFGSLDVAVEQLLKRAMGDNQPLAMIEDRNGDVTEISNQDINVSPSKVSKSSSPTNNWRALQGTDLRKLLKRWSAREGVGFVWDADQSFLVKQTVKSETNYNNAVERLLSQYSVQGVRPVATLNIDPKTNAKTLIITVLSTS